MAENLNNQESTGRLLNPAKIHLERSYRQAIAEREQWFKKNSPTGCAVSFFIGLALPFVFYYTVPVKPVVMAILLVVYLLAFTSAVMAAVLYSRGSIIPMPEIFARYEDHVRHVLFDDRLLALLLTDPGSDLPGMAFASGIAGQPDILRAVDPNSLEQRLILLQSNYEAVCKHFNAQPYPDPVDGKRLPLVAPAPFRMASVAVAIALYEVLTSNENTEVQDTQEQGDAQ